MDRLFMIFGDMGNPKAGGGDSWVDRMNCQYTVFILIIFSLLVTTKHFVGEPIACWAPSEFTDSHVEFTNKVCWTKDTYYLPLTDTYIPKGKKGKMYISYYQWVALVLTCQALLFYLPRPIWRLLNKKSGIAVSTITDAAMECQRKMDPDGRDKVLRYITKHMGRFLVELSRNYLLSAPFKGFCYSMYGSYLIICYCIIKLVYIGNVICQIVWLNKFLGTDYHMYGFRVLTHMVKGESWSTSERFPRVTLCDFSIRTLGNIHNYTVQCSLPLNLFNEKIFIFIWFWFAFVAVATVCSLIMWIAASVHSPHQCRYIKSRLIAMDKLRHDTDECVNKFVRMYLRNDGLFLIRMVAKNSSDLIAAELICGLWDHYLDNRQIIERLESRDQVRKDVKREARALVVKQMSEIT